MTDISEDDIRIRAYALWEADGRPDGSQDAHWLEALRQLSEENKTADSVAEPTSPLSLVVNAPVVAPAAKKRRKTA